MMFVGSKFCPHCGAPVAARKESDGGALPCPCCKTFMRCVAIGKTWLDECGDCFGLWVDVGTFKLICADRESQAQVLGLPQELPKHPPPQRRGYLPCPRCGQLMNRFNFAHHSGIVVDMCKAHGIWFDRDEMRGIIEFIRAGGLERAREFETEQLDMAKRRIEQAQSMANNEFR